MPDPPGVPFNDAHLQSRGIDLSQAASTMRIIGRHTLRWPIRRTTLVTLTLPLIISPRYMARIRARVHPGCKPFSGAGKHLGRPSGRDVIQIKWAATVGF